MRSRNSFINRARLLLVVAVAFFSFGALSHTQGQAAASSNDIVPGGFTSASNFISKLRANSPNDLQTIYASKYNLPTSEYDRFVKEAKKGYSKPNGDIVVDGKVVGTDARSLGRNAKTKSKPVVIDGKTYHESFIGDVTKYNNDVLVLFDKSGKPQTITMNICGNPIRIKEEVPSPPPAPKPDPSYACKALNMEQDGNKATFSTNATAANGAKISKVVYDFGDDSKTVTKTNPSDKVTHTYAPGDYEAKVTVYVDVEGKDSVVIEPAGECVKEITVKAEEKPAIEITKTVDGVHQKTVGLDQEFSYTITVTNKGNVDLKDVKITDTPESGVTLISSNNIGTIKDNKWTHTLSSLAVNEDKTFTLTAKVPTYKAGNIKNTVCVDTPTIPGTNPDDCDEANVDVPKPGNVRVCDPATGDNNKLVPESEKDKYLPVDSPECQPKKIPATGPVEMISGIAGMGSLAGAGYYWRASRRDMIRSILKR